MASRFTIVPDVRKPIRKKLFNKVRDEAGRRVRGLWLRNKVFYAQLRISGKVKQIPLHGAKNVAEARAEMQALKRKIKNGE